MLKGVDIIVWRKTLGEVDEMGEPTKNWEPETVSNVLYAPTGAEWLGGPSGQLPAGYRPDGTGYYRCLLPESVHKKPCRVRARGV